MTILKKQKTDFEFVKNDDEVVKMEVKDLDFSASTRTSLENITSAKSNANDIVYLIDATYTTSSGSSKFIIEGKLSGGKADQVAKKDTIEYTFHNESISGEAIKVSCSVQSHDANDFQLICGPNNFKGNL